ncbi:MAG: hypothetical protein L0J06_01640 [Yaniella sp.]|nr:hypothetical protein [Yaniella sp.]
MIKPHTTLQTLQRVFLWTIIVSFSLSALYGIAVLLGANADTIGSQVVASTLIVGSYSLAMLCCGSVFNKPERPLGRRCRDRRAQHALVIVAGVVRTHNAT